MTTLKNKIDFVAIVSVKMANPNGDPLTGNQPRVNYDGYGEISDVCIKRKIRNRMQASWIECWSNRIIEGWYIHSSKTRYEC